MQLGGMALRDGVLLQGDAYWAAAMRDEAGGIRVVSGSRVKVPGRDLLRQVPLVRGLVRLGEALMILPAVRRQVGRAILPHEDPRLLAATAGSAVATVGLRTIRRGSPLLKELGVLAVGLFPVLLALRDSRVSRYHGAEHKSVAAYESGGESALQHKEHARCGSNLIAPILVTSLGTNLVLRAAGKERRPLATLVAGLVSIGAAMELFAWMAAHQEHPLSRMLRKPGIEMQRRFTTSEPSDDQIDVADRALQELMRLEGETAPV